MYGRPQPGHGTPAWYSSERQARHLAAHRFDHPDPIFLHAVVLGQAKRGWDVAESLILARSGHLPNLERPMRLPTASPNTRGEGMVTNQGWLAVECERHLAAPKLTHTAEVGADVGGRR